MSPPLSVCHSNFLISTLYHPGLTPEQVAETHKSSCPPADPVLRAGRKPHKIAYLTPDCHFHPNYFMQLAHLPYFSKTRFELFVYSTCPERDTYTRLVRAGADHWRDVKGRTPSDIARMIRRDGIDILVDITGHFARSPLPVFALRPAPLQIGTPAYPATSGLGAVDYKLVDAMTDPPGLTEHLYTEKLLRLPRTAFCYAPPPEVSPVATPPFERNGFFTFGSFNNRPKLNPPLLSWWARILRAVPDARLLFHHTFNGTCNVSGDYRDPIVRAFRAEGVSSRRLEFIGGLRFEEHLRLLPAADLALDSFPYNGCTTTCECLWMGVPVLTLSGRAHVSRTGLSILGSLGLTEWIAESPRDYVRRAVAVARRPERLGELRSTLRDRMRCSELTNGRNFVLSLEKAFLAAWSERFTSSAS